MTVYLAVDQILALHQGLIEQAGGSAGLRDRRALEAAAARPAMTFGGDDLYPDLAAKATALMQSLRLDHPFMDGNKRIGVHAAELLVELNGSTLDASDEELEHVTLDVVEGRISAEALAIWFRQRLTSA